MFELNLLNLSSNFRDIKLQVTNWSNSELKSSVSFEEFRIEPSEVAVVMDFNSISHVTKFYIPTKFFRHSIGSCMS